jgi:hypothetical protein
VAELQQFALHVLVSPGRILPGEPFDQGGDGVVDGRAAACVRVGPFLGHQAAVPAQDGGRGDQAVAAQARGEAPDQRSEQRSIGPVQARRGLVLLSTATSWRSTSSSMSLDEVVRPSRVSQLRSWPKIR